MSERKLRVFRSIEEVLDYYLPKDLAERQKAEIERRRRKSIYEEVE